MADFIPSTAEPLPPPYHPGRWTRSARVLVVEDDRDIADVLRRSLAKEGYEVRLAA